MMKSMAYPERGGVALRYPAAALAFVSELIHLWVLPGQLVIAMLPGIFFLLVAMGQGLLAVSLLFGPGRSTVRIGILLNCTPTRTSVRGGQDAGISGTGGIARALLRGGGQSSRR